MRSWLKSYVLAAAAALPMMAATAFAQQYTQTNLVSDLANQGAVTVDPNLKNAWGLARSASSEWWVNSEGTGTSNLYDGQGHIFASLPEVTIPTASGTGTATPTGIIFNGSQDFDLVAGNASTAAPFIFATADGTISAWNPAVKPTTAVIKVNESARKAIFGGLTWAVIDGRHFLFAPNFHSGAVETFDADFTRVGDFAESPVRGFAPYNVQAVGANIIVTYAEQNSAKTLAVEGTGKGFVIVYDLRGRAVTSLQNGPWFNAPWGVALAPQDFGTFSHALLIANRGSGTIAAFNPTTGQFLGNMLDASGKTLVISNLWGIEFGNGQTAGSPLSLYFSAGINNYQDGLFGTLTPVAAELDAEDHE
ncbi:MAG TPA: TIGR03118 family protein [Aliidongia sp.]|nr:TIGR03118 family protein [Aliidongia sp.]